MQEPEQSVPPPRVAVGLRAPLEDRARPPAFAVRRPFVLIVLIPLVANILGSVVNIWYNLNIVEPRLDPPAAAMFHRAIGMYNAAVYPICLVLWYLLLAPLVRCWRALRDGASVDERELLRCRRRAVYASVLGALISVFGWLPSAAVLPMALAVWAPPADPSVYLHIPVSVVVAGTIAVTQTYLLIEYLMTWLLFPIFFRDASPSTIPGARHLSLGARLLIFTIAVGICPVVSQVLLAFASSRGGDGGQYLELVLIVGAIGIFFGIVASWLASRLLLQPLQHLTTAARRVAVGDYGTRLQLQRADELGELMETFNHMTQGLREKQRIEETFGRYVSPEVAHAVLARDPALGGTLQDLTVMFVDIRDFTSRSSRMTPQTVVALLNDILPGMVDAVERHGGIINKFLGDGFMAMFGAPVRREDHADAAVAAAVELVESLEVVNASLVGAGEPAVRIGVGIHTGRAVVGNVGTPRRMEYTAIGDSVNLAQRIEALTRDLGCTILLSEATWSKLRGTFPAVPLAKRMVKGLDQPVTVYGVPTAAAQSNLS